MSDEQRKDEEAEAEVEGHRLRRAANDEPAAEGEDAEQEDPHPLRKDTLRKEEVLTVTRRGPAPAGLFRGPRSLRPGIARFGGVWKIAGQ
jgi:hypothetical protein